MIDKNWKTGTILLFILIFISISSDLFLTDLFLSDVFAFEIPILKSEKTDFLETGRFEESNEQCMAIEKAYPKKAKCEELTTSPEGRSIRVLIISGKKIFSPKNKKNFPVVWIQAGIHAGEIEGKDAGFIFIKKALKNNAFWLNELVLIFCPILNIDGHERFGAWNRSNQNGPKEMGFRVNSQNLNLNRDYVKLDTPEVLSSTIYLNKWDPTVWVDLHTTDGAQFQQDIAVILPTVQSSTGELKKISQKFEDSIQSGLKQKKHLPLYFYPEFNKSDDPMSGIEHFPDLPKMGYNYWSFRNRIGILVETHSWKNYKDRVISTQDTLEEVVQFISKERHTLKDAIKKADEDELTKKDSSTTLSFKVSKKFKTIDFLGYEYKIEMSRLSKQNWIKYNPEKKMIWKMPLFDDVEADVIVQKPTHGYYIDVSYASTILEKLKAHDIQFSKILKSEVKKLKVFRAKEIEFDSKPSESHFRAKWKGEWKEEEIKILPGSLFIPANQPRIKMALYLLEPDSPDSLSSWGFLNAYTEQKEYVEDYVLEDFAREKMKDPEIEKEFNLAISKDEEFKKSPEKRLNFFYKLHPAYDQNYRRLPFFKE